jgi:hypothetical protein
VSPGLKKDSPNMKLNLAMHTSLESDSPSSRQQNSLFPRQAPRCGNASRSPVAYSPPFFLRRGSHTRLVPFLGPVMPPERTERRSIWQNGRARRPVLSIQRALASSPFAAYSLVGQLSAWGEAPGRLFWPPSTVQPCAIFAAFRGDRASCGRLHAFEFELREDNA